MKKRILYLGLLLATLCSGVATAQNTQGQTRLAKEERTRYVSDSLLSSRLNDSIGKLRDSLRLMATKTYVIENYVTTSDSRLSDSRVPTGTAGGDLTGTYPNPTIKSSVALTGSPTAPTPSLADNSTRIATTAYVKSKIDESSITVDSELSSTSTNPVQNKVVYEYFDEWITNVEVFAEMVEERFERDEENFDDMYENVERFAEGVENRLDGIENALTSNYVTTDDSRLTDSRTPKGNAGGDLKGTYPNPTIKESVNLTGSPTAPTPATTDNSTRIATTAYVNAFAPHVIAAGMYMSNTMSWYVGSGNLYYKDEKKHYEITQYGSTSRGCVLVTPIGSSPVYAHISRNSTTVYIKFYDSNNNPVSSDFYYMFISWQ